jgi:hypothetical protein
VLLRAKSLPRLPRDWFLSMGRESGGMKEGRLAPHTIARANG